VWTAPLTGRGEQGNEPTCCIEGRGLNKIAEKLIASKEGFVLHGVVSDYFVNCSGENLQKNYCAVSFDSLSYFVFVVIEHH
jgi:hypothetical protein